MTLNGFITSSLDCHILPSSIWMVSTMKKRRVVGNFLCRSYSFYYFFCNGLSKRKCQDLCKSAERLIFVLSADVIKWTSAPSLLLQVPWGEFSSWLWHDRNKIFQSAHEQAVLRFQPKDIGGVRQNVKGVTRRIENASLTSSCSFLKNFARQTCQRKGWGLLQEVEAPRTF